MIFFFIPFPISLKQKRYFFLYFPAAKQRAHGSSGIRFQFANVNGQIGRKILQLIRSLFYGEPDFIGNAIYPQYIFVCF